MPFDLPSGDPQKLGLDQGQLDRLIDTIEKHVAEGWYPGCEIALARHGKLVLSRHFGNARIAPQKVKADANTLWLLYSNTKVLTAAAMWQLAERGHFRFTDTVAEHLPGFEKNGKRDVTILQVITHQGGFPDAVFKGETFESIEKRREAACNITLQWTPGAQVSYHPLAAHWVIAAMMEAVTGKDFKALIREELIEPLGLGDEIYVGLPEILHGRAADMHIPEDGKPTTQKLLDEANNALWRRAGAPGGGGYATARAMAAFYQMLLQGGTLNGKRVLSPATIRYATRNFTGDRVDNYMGMPMHRGLGPHLRGKTDNIRGMGSLAAPETFGHGGVGSSYCWADPHSGVSFAYLTNSRQPDPWHSKRLDTISNFVHSAIIG
jgi:CubicO group peptidase (beta-lactamase class C family)